MIPMADNLNHSCVDVTQELINLKLNLEGPVNHSYFRVSKSLNDYTSIYAKNGLTQEEINKHGLNAKGRHNKEMYETNSKLLSTENLRQTISDLDKHIWEIPYYLDRYIEDNDSEDEEDEKDESAFEGKMVEEMMKQEGNILNKKKKKSKISHTEGLQTLLKDTKFENSTFQKILEDKNKIIETKNKPLDLEVEDNELIIAEYYPVEEEGIVKEREV